MDLWSYYGWFAFGGMLAVWLVIVGARLVGHKWRPALAVFSTIVLVLFGAALLANERWGTVPRHEAKCDRWRERYERATTMVDLERAKDGLRASRCAILDD